MSQSGLFSPLPRQYILQISGQVQELVEKEGTRVEQAMSLQHKKKNHVNVKRETDTACLGLVHGDELPHTERCYEEAAVFQVAKPCASCRWIQGVRMCLKTNTVL